MIVGILAALGSSSMRACLNILDRLAFGHRRAEVISLNLINNFLPLFLIFPVAVLLKPELSAAALCDLRNVWLAGLVQLVAYAFSLAFRKLTIPQVIVYSKLPDLLIPLGIYIFDGFFSVVDFFFSALTTLVCLPILFETRHHRRKSDEGQWKPLLFLMGAVFLRGALSGKFVQEQGSYPGVWLPITAAILWWRFVWTLVVTLSSMAMYGKPRWISPGRSIVVCRGAVTLAVQSLYVLALAAGPTMAVWPIINSTALFATVFSAVLLHERPTRYEVIAVCGIVALTLTRMFWPSE